MGKIRSALELAMEKTADLKIDKEKLKHNELKKKGQILASSILNGKEKDGGSILKDFRADEMKSITEGFLETLLSNIRLPLYINSDNNLKILENAFALISDKEEIYSLVFNQLEQIFDKFKEDVQNLSEGLKQQYMPILMQKQQQIMQKTGQNIQIEPEQDPEFLELLSKHRKELEGQYNRVIAQAKSELIKIV
jgi:hypothetical protein